MYASLTPELERLIHDHIERGCDQLASEVIRDGLQPLEGDPLRQLHLADMRDRIAAGLRSLDHDESVPGEEAFDELLTELR